MAATPKQLIEGHDGLYVTIGDGSGGYGLYRVNLVRVGWFRRKWMAVKTANGEPIGP